MSALAQAVGATVPHEFAHKGKTYKVSLITQAVKVAYEKKLFARAKDAAAGMRELMSSEEYQAHLRQLNDDYLNGEYSLESPRGQSSLKTAPGVLSLCALLFGTDEMEMLQLMNQRREDMESLLSLLIKESFGVEDGEAEGDDPNA